MLAWCDLTLLETAGQAKAQRNPGAVVAAYASLDWMCGLGIFTTWLQRPQAPSLSFYVIFT